MNLLECKGSIVKVQNLNLYVQGNMKKIWFFIGCNENNENNEFVSLSEWRKLNRGFSKSYRDGDQTLYTEEQHKFIKQVSSCGDRAHDQTCWTEYRWTELCFKHRGFDSFTEAIEF